MKAGWKTEGAEVCSELERSGVEHLVLLSQDLHQLCVDLLCLVRYLHVAVMHQDEVLVFVAGGGRHLGATTPSVCLAAPRMQTNALKWTLLFRGPHYRSQL